MNNKTKIIIIGIVAIALFLLPVMVTAEVYGTTTCTYFNKFPIGSGYSCNENNQIYRTFLNPGGYDRMVQFYAPTLPEEPLYTFVTGSATETFSGE